MTWMLRESLEQHLAGCCVEVCHTETNMPASALQASSRAASGNPFPVGSKCGAAIHRCKARLGRQGPLQALSIIGMATSGRRSQAPPCKGSRGTASLQRRCSMCGRSLIDCHATEDARRACNDVHIVH